ncbi:hypothetical protein GGI07_004525 [Coemansia sp. Benny D115]|nr:hypothetical protein GGI07_004525 [Coemansia sp. Benny D115]
MSDALAVIPNSAYKIPNRCLIAKVPSHEYLGIRWGLYYGWFVISAALSMMCMVSVLFSARKLTHSTHLRGRTTPSSTEAYRGAVNARANSKRLRSLVFYTIAYPLISLVCNFPQLIFELLSATTKRQIQGLGFASRLLLYSEGMFLSLAFFLYPAVLHSIRDINHSAVQYWVVEQEEYWRLKNSEMKHTGRTNLMSEDRSEMLVDRRDIKNFTSLRGRIYHFVFSRTSEGMRASGR